MVIPFMMLAFESGGVVSLRMMKLLSGGSAAFEEAHLMFSEKVEAAFEAGSNLMAGASGEDLIHRYRQYVAANAERLSSKQDVLS